MGLVDTACLLPSEVRMTGPPSAGKKVDSEEGKGFAQVGSARLWCRGATSRASDVLPNVPNSHPPNLFHPPSRHALSLGFVAVTHILAYLEAMTGRSPQDARLQTLARSLDPNGEGLQATVDLDTFLLVMRDWIAACQLDGWVLVPPPSPGSPS